MDNTDILPDFNDTIFYDSIPQEEREDIEDAVDEIIALHREKSSPDKQTGF